MGLTGYTTGPPDAHQATGACTLDCYPTCVGDVPALVLAGIARGLAWQISRKEMRYPQLIPIRDMFPTATEPALKKKTSQNVNRATILKKKLGELASEKPNESSDSSDSSGPTRNSARLVTASGHGCNSARLVTASGHGCVMA